MIAEWNQFSEQWATTIVQLIWQGSIAIFIIWAIGKLWPTMPASKRHWLWRLVYLKLFALIIWQTPVSLALLPSPETVSLERLFTICSLNFVTPTASGMHQDYCLIHGSLPRWSLDALGLVSLSRSLLTRNHSRQKHE